MFGDIVDGRMILNEYGQIVKNVWQTLPDHHPVILDKFQTMPNHVHFVIQLTRPAETGGSRPETGGSRPAPTVTLGNIVGLFKSECTKQIHRTTVGATRGSPVTTVWQRNYYENIIRTQDDLDKIRKYIIDNPRMWERDRNNPQFIINRNNAH